MKRGLQAPKGYRLYEVMEDKRKELDEGKKRELDRIQLLGEIG